MGKSVSEQLIGHGRFECIHGFVVKECTCHVNGEEQHEIHIVSCVTVPAHTQRIEELEHPLYVGYVEDNGDMRITTKIARLYKSQWTYDELVILDDALAYYANSYPFEMNPPPEPYTNGDVRGISDRISKLRETAAELEPL